MTQEAGCILAGGDTTKRTTIYTFVRDKTNMTNTRAASATVRLRAKQELVRLLFGSQLVRKGHQAHRLLDHSIYSYDDLRSAYLKRIHELHPDKRRAELATADTSDSITTIPRILVHQSARSVRNTTIKPEDTSNFVELQNAWSRYEEFARMIKKVGKGADGDRRHLQVDANFTMFGVGCSFSDNEQEKELRSKIMDEASRGWFSAGQLSETSLSQRLDGRPKAHTAQLSLASDDLFDQITEDEHGNRNEKSINRKSKPRSSLIAHLIPPHRR